MSIIGEFSENQAPLCFPKLLIISLLNKQLFGLEMVKLVHLKGDALHGLDLVVHSFHTAVALREINAVRKHAKPILVGT